MGHIFWNERIKLIDSGELVEVLAIGDSWFNYHANNLITPLYSALNQPTVYVIGENGARADQLCKGTWLANFRTMLNDYPGIRLVCISAGGNDFAGLGDLDDKILKPNCSAETDADACYRAGEPDGVFNAVEDAYCTLITAVAAVRSDVTILLHNYDYAIPDGRTVAGIPSWLKLPMDNCRTPLAGAPLGGMRRELVRSLIDHFSLRMDHLASTSNGPGHPFVELVWSAGTLPDSGWANELHPRPSGFNKLVNECWSGPARKVFGLT